MVPILNPATVPRRRCGPCRGTSTPTCLLQGFARDARANGGRIVTGARVTAIARTARAGA